MQDIACAIFRNQITVQFWEAVLFGRVQKINVPKNLTDLEDEGQR